MYISMTYDNHVRAWKRILWSRLQNDLIKNEYKIISKCATTSNPQASWTLERIHQVLANLVHMFDLKNNYLDEDDLWAGILAATTFFILSTYHTMLRAMPGQMVFVRDMILNTQVINYSETIKKYKHKLIHKNNQLKQM